MYKKNTVVNGQTNKMNPLNETIDENKSKILSKKRKLPNDDKINQSPKKIVSQSRFRNNDLIKSHINFDNFACDFDMKEVN